MYSVTEKQFAHLIGRCKMYHHLPNEMKVNISPMLFGVTEISRVAKDYYRAKIFCKDTNGERGVNAFNLANDIRGALGGRIVGICKTNKKATPLRSGFFA